jgi:small multidrug resistance family-3 protein
MSRTLIKLERLEWKFRNLACILYYSSVNLALAAIGGVILFVYEIIPTLQPAEFGRVYAASGGIFMISAIICGRIVDKKRPDRYKIIGSIVAVVGALVIFYAPR